MCVPLNSRKKSNLRCYVKDGDRPGSLKGSLGIRLGHLKSHTQTRESGNETGVYMCNSLSYIPSSREESSIRLGDSKQSNGYTRCVLTIGGRCRVAVTNLNYGCSMVAGVWGDFI